MIMSQCHGLFLHLPTGMCNSVNKALKLMPNRRQFAAGAASRTCELFELNRLFATRLCRSTDS